MLSRCVWEERKGGKKGTKKDVVDGEAAVAETYNKWKMNTKTH